MLFRDIIGQDDLKRDLIKRVNEGTVAHANLFLGANGYGGYALALAMARYMVCDDRQPEDACGKCPSCLKFNSMQYPDLHFSYPIRSMGGNGKNVSEAFNEEWRKFIASNAYPGYEQWLKVLDETKATRNQEIYVDEAQNIARKLALKSYEGKFKFQIIWMAELINMEAANKLLKTLEEPPEGSIFFMIAEKGDNMLNTILSRTQLVKVPAIDDLSMKQALVSRHGMGDEQAENVAHYVEGDYLKALDVISNSEEQRVFLERFKDWMRACYKRDAKKINSIAMELAKMNLPAQLQFVDYALHFVRQCIVSNYGEDQLARFSNDERGFAQKFAPFIHHGNVIRINELLNEAYTDLRGYVNAKIVFADLSLKMHNELHRPH